MNNAWLNEFRQRMSGFGDSFPSESDGLAISVKVRIISGCFHREHSPHAYILIDKAVRTAENKGEPFSFLEHESGPEMIAYATAVVGMATAFIGLITAVINARSKGIKAGDRPNDPIEVIVRGYQQNDIYFEETILKINAGDEVTLDLVEKVLNGRIRKAALDTAPLKPDGHVIDAVKSEAEIVTADQSDVVPPKPQVKRPRRKVQTPPAESESNTQTIGNNRAV